MRRRELPRPSLHSEILDRQPGRQGYPTLHHWIQGNFRSLGRSPVAASISAALAASVLFAFPCAAQSSVNFPLAGGTLNNQRFSTLTQITPANVARLGAAWMMHVADGSAASPMQATPVVVDGVMYVPAAGSILALDATTGAVKWRYKAAGPAATLRGVTVAEGKVFTGGGKNTLIALNSGTGELLWTATVGERGLTMAPAYYYQGRVFMGVSGGESGVRGFFGAYDAETGKPVWGFWTTPGPGERGHETWAGDSWQHGGGPVWTQPAIDPDLGMVYIAAGNASPDEDGTARAGDNLFTASIVALDLKTGAYKWHYQEVHHDLWDYDNAVSPVLADIPFHGRTRKVLLHAGKTGMIYVFDRVTGKPLIPIDERPVPQEPRNHTAATQPFSRADTFVPTCPEPGSVPAGMKSSCVFGAFWDEPVVMTPGTLGGSSWAPLSYSPLTHLLYVAGGIMNSQFTIHREEWNPDTNRLRSLDQNRGMGHPVGQPRAGTLTAINPATGKIVWQQRKPYPLGAGSGFLNTATGLLFHGEPDGRFVAYNARNGSELWSFQTGAGADAPAITYEVAGQQYLAILAGGNAFSRSPRGDSLWVFKLGGDLPPAPAPPRPPDHQLGRGAGR